MACAEDEVEVLKVARRVQVLPVDELADAWAAASKQPQPHRRIENIWCAAALARAHRCAPRHARTHPRAPFLRPPSPSAVCHVHADARGSWRSWSSRAWRTQAQASAQQPRRPAERAAPQAPEAVPPLVALLSALVWLGLMYSVGRLVVSTSLYPWPGGDELDFSGRDDMDDDYD